MSVQEMNLEDFASLEWATPSLTSPLWNVYERNRHASPANVSDRFCGQMVINSQGIQHWIEAYERPKAGSNIVKRSISLCKLGAGLNSYPGICHGGLSMTIMDEALGFMMIANEQERLGNWENVGTGWKKQLDEGRPLNEIMDGFVVTAKCDFTFLMPVVCPGLIGVDVEMLENKGHKMRMRGTLKDANGQVLVIAEGMWVRIGGAAKL